MFTALKYILRSTNQSRPTGALVDERPDAEKANDPTFAEVVGSAAPVAWQEKWPDAIRRFPDQDQKQSFTCGANALSKSEAVHFAQKYGYLPFSRPDIYQRRSNMPAAGMAMWDMFDIASKGLVPTSFTAEKPERLFQDSDYEALPIDRWAKGLEPFKVRGNVKLPADVEAIASVIQQTGKAPVALTYFTAGEWSKEIPYIVESGMRVGDPSALRHFVAITDFTLYNGRKYLVVEDSAWFGGYRRRLASEEWVRERFYEVRYGMNFAFEQGTSRPSYDGLTVVSAQLCLRSLGYFPTNVATAEVVGPVTRQAIAKFQAANGLPQTQALDPETKKALHAQFP